MAHLMDQIDISKRSKGIFHATLKGADVGDEIVYHIGLFASGPHRLEAYGNYSVGLCVLYQRRLGKAKFAYIAKKTRA